MNKDNAIVMLVVGHTPKRKGAKNEKNTELNEYDINSNIATMIKNQLSMKDVDVMVISDLATKSKTKIINEICRSTVGTVKIQVSMHFNAFKGYISNTSGCEVLVSDKKINSAGLAESLLDEFSTMNQNRGIKIRTKGSRGYAILNTESDYSVLCEPLFIDAEEGEALSDPIMTDFLVDSYVNGITNFIERI